MKLEKLSHIKNILPEIIENLNLVNNGTLIRNATNYVQITNIKNFKSAISLLDNIFGLENLSVNIRKILENSVSDTEQVTQNEYTKLSKEILELKKYLLAFYTLLHSQIPDESKNSLNIKLPPINDFEDLSKVSKELHNAISKVIFNEDINGTEQIVSVENGSIWINVIVGAGALPLMGSLIWAASAVYKYILQCRVAEEHLRGLKLQHDGIENILKLQVSSIKNVIEAEAIFIQSEHFKNNEAENLEQIKNSIRIFSELIQKGAEIKPAITSPKEIKGLFPSVSPELIESRAIKKIENE